MDEMRNEHQQIREFQHAQPNHMSASELISLLQHVSNMYPTQFIVEMTYYYVTDSNTTLVDITTTGERFPNQYAKPEPVIRPHNNG